VFKFEEYFFLPKNSSFLFTFICNSVIHWSPYQMNYWDNAFSCTKLKFSLNGAHAKLQETVYLPLRITVFMVK
jgi:hypothetical protein